MGIISNINGKPIAQLFGSKLSIESELIPNSCVPGDQ